MPFVTAGKYPWREKAAAYSQHHIHARMTFAAALTEACAEEPSGAPLSMKKSACSPSGLPAADPKTTTRLPLWRQRSTSQAARGPKDSQSRTAKSWTSSGRGRPKPL